MATRKRKSTRRKRTVSRARSRTIHLRASRGQATRTRSRSGSMINYGDTSKAAMKRWSPKYRAQFRKQGGVKGFRNRERRRAGLKSAGGSLVRVRGHQRGGRVGKVTVKDYQRGRAGSGSRSKSRLGRSQPSMDRRTAAPPRRKRRLK